MFMSRPCGLLALRVLTVVSVLCRFHSLNCIQRTAGNTGQSAPSVWTATKRLKRRGAVAIRWLLISRSSAGTGSSRRRSTRPTTAPGSVRTCSCRSTRTHISWPWRTLQGLPVPAAPHARCLPSRCYTSTMSITSYTVCCQGWWWTDVAVRRGTMLCHVRAKTQWLGTATAVRMWIRPTQQLLSN
jgi:hypothetical protein